MLIGGSREVVPRTAVDEAPLDREHLDLGSSRRAREELFLAAVDQVRGLLTAELPRRAAADATDRRDARTVSQDPLATALHFQAARRRWSHAYVAVVRPGITVDRVRPVGHAPTGSRPVIVSWGLYPRPRASEGKNAPGSCEPPAGDALLGGDPFTRPRCRARFARVQPAA